MGNCWPKHFATSNSTRRPSLVHENVKHNKQPAAADQGGGDAAVIPPSGETNIPNLKEFSYNELGRATGYFRPDTLLGEGGFGRVYKGYIDEKTLAPSRAGVGIPVAIKRCNPDGKQGFDEWEAEVKILGKFSHPNLVKLLGFCWEKKQLLLVYEYMQRGSLDNHLFRRGGASEQLTWNVRMKIMLGAARGLIMLHTTKKTVIYRDFKSSNILLDQDFNAKISDFGLAKLGPVDGNSHLTTRVFGTYGYAAPEYINQGRLYVASDVYSFGVVLLEIITGLRVSDWSRPSDERNLVDWALPLLLNKNKLKKLMDPHLQDGYPLKAACAIGKLIKECISIKPKSRPQMDVVLLTLEKISQIPMKQKKQKNPPKQTQQQHRHHQQSPLHTYHGSGGGRRYQQQNGKASCSY